MGACRRAGIAGVELVDEAWAGAGGEPAAVPARSRRGRRPQPEVHVRAVRDRRRQPARARGGAGRRGDAGPGLQPALHPRPPGPRQDAPPPRDRQLRRALRRRPDGSATPPSRRSRPSSSRPSAASGTRRASGSASATSDVLLIDDVQFLADKVRTEEEFFHTFNALYEAGAPAGDHERPQPRDLEALEARLRERFECGLVAELEPPDRRRPPTPSCASASARTRSTIADETLSRSSRERVVASVRVLEGALIRVVAYASLAASRPPGARDARCSAASTRRGTARALLARRSRRRPPSEFGVSADGPARPRPHAAASRSRARSPCTWPASSPTRRCPRIGREFGGRNHTTVLHAWKRVSELVDKPGEKRETVDAHPPTASSARPVTTAAVDRIHNLNHASSTARSPLQRAECARLSTSAQLLLPPDRTRSMKFSIPREISSWPASASPPAACRRAARSRPCPASSSGPRGPARTPGHRHGAGDAGLA